MLGRGTIMEQILVRSASRCPHAGFRTAWARSLMVPGGSASDRLEARQAMALESLVEAA